jgi:hypothetical protein
VRVHDATARMGGVSDLSATTPEPAAPVHAPPLTVGRPSSVAVGVPVAPPVVAPPVVPSLQTAAPTMTQPTPPPAEVSAAPTTTPRARGRLRAPGLPPAWPMLLTAVALFGAAILVLVLIVADKPRYTHRNAASASPTQSNIATTTPSAATASSNGLKVPGRVSTYPSINLGSSARDIVKQYEPSTPAKDRAVIDKIYRDMIIGAYGTRASPGLILIAFPVADLPTAHGKKLDPSLVATLLLSGSPLRSFASFPAGPAGGAVTCGSAASPKTTVACTWADQKSAGFVLSEAKPAIPLSKLAQLTNVARAQVDR